MGTNAAFLTNLGDDERGGSGSEGINKGDILDAVSMVQSLMGELLAPSSSELLVDVSESHLSPNLNILAVSPCAGERHS